MARAGLGDVMNQFIKLPDGTIINVAHVRRYEVMKDAYDFIYGDRLRHWCEVIGVDCEIIREQIGQR